MALQPYSIQLMARDSDRWILHDRIKRAKTDGHAVQITRDFCDVFESKSTPDERAAAYKEYIFGSMPQVYSANCDVGAIGSYLAIAKYLVEDVLSHAQLHMPIAVMKEQLCATICGFKKRALFSLEHSEGGSMIRIQSDFAIYGSIEHVTHREEPVAGTRMSIVCAHYCVRALSGMSENDMRSSIEWLRDKLIEPYEDWCDDNDEEYILW
jgi:hypothetical protein